MSDKKNLNTFFLFVHNMIYNTRDYSDMDTIKRMYTVIEETLMH
jgi:hypothetical protein